MLHARERQTLSYITSNCGVGQFQGICWPRCTSLNRFDILQIGFIILSHFWQIKTKQEADLCDVTLCLQHMYMTWVCITAKQCYGVTLSCQLACEIRTYSNTVLWIALHNAGIKPFMYRVQWDTIAGKEDLRRGHGSLCFTWMNQKEIFTLAAIFHLGILGIAPWFMERHNREANILYGSLEYKIQLWDVMNL